MPSTFTDNTGIEKIADGEQTGLWGQTTNLNFDIVDRALNGSVLISLSGTTHTLTTSSGLLSDGQFKVLVFGGSPSGTNTVTIAPDTAQKVYFVINSSGESVVLSQGSGASVTVANGGSAIIFTDGAGATAAVTDITAPFATLTGTQTLTNKTIDAAANTLTGVATLTGTQTLTNKTLTAPEFTGAIYNNGSFRGNVVAVAALDIDLSAGNYFTKSISANSTFTFSGTPASRAFGFTLRVTVTGDIAITWPASVEFPGDEAPTLTASKTHLFMFATDDGGTTFRGAFLADYEA
jgi:hypothetical protein